MQYIDSAEPPDPIVVEALLLWGINPNTKDCFGRTPLLEACKQAKCGAPIISLLLEYGANPNYTSSTSAAPGNGRSTLGQYLLWHKTADPQVVKLLLRSGFDLRLLRDTGQLRKVQQIKYELVVEQKCQMLWLMNKKFKAKHFVLPDLIKYA